MLNRHNVKTSIMRVACGAGLTLGTLAFSGCVGTDLLGFELGPNASNILVIQGVIPPNRTPTGCSFASGTTSFLLAGQMEFGIPGEEVEGTYLAVVDVENKNAVAQPQPNTPRPGSETYRGHFGSTNSGDLEIVGAQVRYDYPDFSFSPAETLTRRRTTNFPGEGIIKGMSTAAAGNLRAASRGGVAVTLVTRELLTALAEDPQVVARSNGNTFEPFDVIAYMTLEARLGSGGRITSNELAFRIRMSKEIIKNCARVTDECNAARQAGDPEQRGVRSNLQCLFQADQDVPECLAACEAVAP